jgi:hypothetical protein
MGSEEADTQTVLSEVYKFLERSKNDLQKDLIQDGTGQKSSRELDEEFTVKYSENKDTPVKYQEYYREE